MAETYCGKVCSQCPEMEQALCQGCKTGPGKRFGGDCKVASCVQEKGHECCETCGFHNGCAKYRNRHQVPDDRRLAAQEWEHRKIQLTHKSEVLGKWIWYLFLLVIPNTIGSVMTQESTWGACSVVIIIGNLLQSACSLAYGAILLKVAVEEEKYQTAGAFVLIAAVGGLLTFGVDDSGLTFLIGVLITIVNLYGQYFEYMGHASALQYVDDELSANWENLWKWDIGMRIGMICSAFLVLVPLIGILLLFGVAIGVIVVSILKLVYLYQTAKAFREYL